jgi:hypothetical protein
LFAPFVVIECRKIESSLCALTWTIVISKLILQYPETTKRVALHASVESVGRALTVNFPNIKETVKSELTFQFSETAKTPVSHTSVESVGRASARNLWLSYM